MLNIEWQDYVGQDLTVGTFVLWKTGDVSLIGDVNTSFGVCDDCRTHKCDHDQNEFYQIKNELKRISILTKKEEDIEKAKKYDVEIEWAKSQIDKIYKLPIPEKIMLRLKE